MKVLVQVALRPLELCHDMLFLMKDHKLISSTSLCLVSRSRQQLICDNSSIFRYHCSVYTQGHLHCTVQTLLRRLIAGSFE